MKNNPVWNESFSFPIMNNSDIEIQVMDDDIFKDDKVSTINICRDQLPNSYGDEKEYSIPLCHKNKDIGILHIRIRNGNNNINQNQIPNENLQTSPNDEITNNNDNEENYSDNRNMNSNNHNSNKDDNFHGTLRDEDYKDRLPSNNNDAAPVNTTLDTNDRLSDVKLSGNNHDLVSASENINRMELNDENTNKNQKQRKSRHKHDHPYNRKVLLPEKHHHYEDGYLSSASEASNEGERQRAAQGKLGTHESTSTKQDNAIDTNPDVRNNNTNTNDY